MSSEQIFFCLKCLNDIIDTISNNHIFNIDTYFQFGYNLGRIFAILNEKKIKHPWKPYLYNYDLQQAYHFLGSQYSIYHINQIIDYGFAQGYINQLNINNQIVCWFPVSFLSNQMVPVYVGNHPQYHFHNNFKNNYYYLSVFPSDEDINWMHIRDKINLIKSFI